MTDRELDALVAEKVMGWKRHPSVGVWYPLNLHPLQNVYGHVLPPYSTSIVAAWEVVEKIGEKYAIELHWRESMWNCSIEEGDEVTAHYIATAESRNASKAICLAALKAVGVEVPA